MNVVFATQLLTLIDSLLTAGVTLGPQIATLVKAAIGGSEPTDADWATLDALEQSLSDQIDAASK